MQDHCKVRFCMPRICPHKRQNIKMFCRVIFAFCQLDVISNRRQISVLILSEFKRINELYV